MKARMAALGLAVFVAAGPAAAQTKETSGAWDLLREILAVPGVSGQEKPAAEFIAARLPKGVDVKHDARGDVWFTAGSGGPHILFVAHMDELGWTVDSFLPDGRVRLKGTGGVLPPTVDASILVVHTGRGPVPGVVRPRAVVEQPAPLTSSATSQSTPPRDGAQASAPAGQTPPGARVYPGGQPPAEAYELDLGVSSEAEARALGVAPGNAVTFKKTLVDLAPGVMSARAVDDRAGCVALLEAALLLDLKALGRTVTFAWSVQEEVGLVGAAALAEAIKPDYVFAIDTFVSTDSPLESRRIAGARIGAGAVLRAVDSSNITPKDLIRRAWDLAASRGIPVQAFNSRGGNDGSVFVPLGAADVPLAWPGAYAHSRIEKIDRRDLDALTSLIVAVAEGW